MMQIIEQLEAKQRHYKRKIENMGTGLALFKISATDSQYGYAKYHFMFNNGRKPPLDIAIDIQDTSIEYISWFVQDEKLSFWEDEISVLCHENCISFFDFGFSEEQYYINIEDDFELLKKKDGLWVLRKKEFSRLNGYKLGELTYLLVDNENDFAGIWWKNITLEEYHELKLADAI